MKRLRNLLILVYILAFIFASNVYAKTVYILNFNDFHSMIYHNKSSDKDVPGMVFFMNAILSEIKKDGKDNVILVSGGDNYFGTIVSYDTKGAPVSDMFRELRVAFSAIGNHEFDWGHKYFEEWQKDGNFSYLAANIIDEKTGKNPSWVSSYKIVKINGVKLAFIGLSTLETVSATGAKDLAGLKITKPWDSAQYWIDYLKAGKDKEGIPDVIVALTHIPSVQDKTTGKISGEEINNLCLKTRGLDIVISGHSHETVCGKINRIFVIQAEGHGKKYGITKVVVDDITGKISKIEPKVCDVPVDVEILPENRGEKILAKYSDIEKKYSKVIGKTKTVLSYNRMTINALGVYMAKLIAESTNSQIAFINGGGIRGGLERGNITVGDIFRISPFDNSLVTMKLSGKSIKAVMEHGLDNHGGHRLCVQFYGLKVKFDSSKSVGERVVSITLNNGQEIEMDKYYSVCVNDFMFSGGDGYKFGGGIEVKIHSDLFVRDILIKSIEKEKVLTLPEPDCLIDVTEQELKEAA